MGEPTSPRSAIITFLLFRDVLAGVNHAWQNDRSQLQAASRKITDYLQEVSRWNLSGAKLNQQNLEKARGALVASYDWLSGGWGSAPKFPQPMAVEFLLRQAVRGDHSSFKVSNHILETMSRGGMYDLVGGGFHRYSIDNSWLIPHFEKMLYDNAQLAQAYLHAYCLSGNPAWRSVCEATLDFITRELTSPQGGFYSSLDADSEGKEGIFYTWSEAEIRRIAGNPEDGDLFITAYDVTEAGNIDGLNVLQRTLSDSELAARFAVTNPKVQESLEKMLGRLFIARSRRVRPATDDKVLVAWNGLTMQTFAEAACILNRPDYLDVAMRNAAFVLENLYRSQLFRSWRSGQAHHPAYLEDYASLILGLLALYQADPQLRWFSSGSQTG